MCTQEEEYVYRARHVAGTKMSITFCLFDTKMAPSKTTQPFSPEDYGLPETFRLINYTKLKG
ncbi:hypothetical protein P5673_003652 [Acropora cervicornis]|uniref:Uncharacterized protein n=1 Tax=Acropora cervicornis TaxID=6130 RepID=A0AAD9R0W8_ACRCE|nr:hypothetical protein P5673_003652 [Acropora cervicornis]